MFNLKTILLSKAAFKSGLRSYILGIETSCDDTGVGIVDKSKGSLTYDKVDSQAHISSRTGGVIPTVARQMHKGKLHTCVNQTFDESGLSFKDISHIAVTVKPGMQLSLEVGRDYAVTKAKELNVPIIPIHHMEAHALTVRMLDQSVDFPYLFLLVSGGNSLLGLAKSVDDFDVYGDKKDISPGECLDKISRFLKLTGIKGTMNEYSGGKAIEEMALKNKSSDLFNFAITRFFNLKTCDFAFDGIKLHVYNYAMNNPSDFMNDIPRLCASVLRSMSTHMCSRVLRAMQYCDYTMDKPPKTLVVAGGVASNSLIRASLELACKEFDYEMKVPPVKYCTDNGAMIAWNGYELWRLNKRIVTDVNTIDFTGRAPLGINKSSEINSSRIDVPKLKLKPIFVNSNV